MNAKIAQSELVLDTPSSLKQDVVSHSVTALIESIASPQGITTGQLLGFENGWPVVMYPNCPVTKGLIAQTIVALTSDKLGKFVLLAFENQNPKKPIVIGLLLEPNENSNNTTPINMEIDGERLLLRAEREIVLQCGEASLTLTRAGKVLIKGTYVLSRSKGYNKIKGAAVDIN